MKQVVSIFVKTAGSGISTLSNPSQYKVIFVWGQNTQGVDSVAFHSGFPSTVFPVLSWSRDKLLSLHRRRHSLSEKRRRNLPWISLYSLLF